MAYRHTAGPRTHVFADLAALMAKATPVRSGDRLAGVAAESAEEAVAARWCLAEVPLREILARPLIPYEADDVTRLILDTHDAGAFAEIAHLTVGDLRDLLLRTAVADDAGARLAALGPALTPEMVAAVSKLMRNQDLISVARAVRVTAGFRTTIGLPGTLATRLQPNHPTDDPQGIAAATLDGLLLGCGDAVIGINPATDKPYSLPTTITVSAAETASTAKGSDLDTLTITQNGYDTVTGTTGNGWQLGTPTSVTTKDPWGFDPKPDVTTVTAYNADGQVAQNRQPKSNGTDAGTRTRRTVWM